MVGTVYYYCVCIMIRNAYRRESGENVRTVIVICGWIVENIVECVLNVFNINLTSGFGEASLFVDRFNSKNAIVLMNF